MIISLVAAIGKNRELGIRNGLPWHIPSDFRRFRALTSGHTVIMGSRTFESIGRPLPDRRNIVLSKEPGFQAPGCEVTDSLDAALESVKDEPEVFVIGGAQIYAATLPLAHRMYLTHIEASPEADAFFPAFDPAEWSVVSSEHVAKSATEPYEYTLKIYERK